MEKSENKVFKKLATIFFTIISFWIPVIGLITWWVNRKPYPKDAKIYLTAALLGFAANYILMSL